MNCQILLKKTDFTWNEKRTEIGTLRLMPKSQNLKIISNETVNELTCRGIKSSMHDFKIKRYKKHWTKSIVISYFLWKKNS